jgi:predicted ATPase
MHNFVILSGCSGGGKSTILKELAARGHATVEEPGRRIVAQEQAQGGTALPWIDLSAFAERAIAMALDDRQKASPLRGWVFFDRSLIDATSALAAASGNRRELEKLATDNRYHRRVFMTPPWPEIYATDAERQHGLAAAIKEYERLLDDYARLGYEVVLLPKLPVAQRVEKLLDVLATDRDEQVT